MSKFSKFMKANKKVKANEMHPVTKSLCDEQGNPLPKRTRKSGRVAPLKFPLLASRVCTVRR